MENFPLNIHTTLKAAHTPQSGANFAANPLLTNLSVTRPDINRKTLAVRIKWTCSVVQRGCSISAAFPSNDKTHIIDMDCRPRRCIYFLLFITFPILPIALYCPLMSLKIDGWWQEAEKAALSNQRIRQSKNKQELLKEPLSNQANK